MPKSNLEQTVSKKLRMVLNGVAILENTRPDWLISSQGERLELDFYIPELDLAIEVQGQQHYTFVPHFHFNQNGFSDQLRRDREKRYLCEHKGLFLLEIASSDQLDGLTAKIIAMVPQAETNKEFVARMKNKNKTMLRKNVKGKKLKKIRRLIEKRNNILRNMGDRNSKKDENRQNAIDGIDNQLSKVLK